MVHTLSILALLAASTAHTPAAQPEQPDPKADVAPEPGKQLTLDQTLDRYIQAANAGKKVKYSDVQDALEQAMEREVLTAAVRAKFFRRATELKPTDDWWSDPSAELLLMISPEIEEDDLSVIREVFPKLNPNAKGAALLCITHIDDKPAAQTFLDLALAASKANELPMLMLGDYAESDTALPILVPAILELTRHDDQPAYEVFNLFLDLVQDDRLTDETKAKTMTAAQAAIARIVPRVLQYEKDTPLALRTPKQQEDHDDLCALAGLILDIVSHADAATIERIARPALAVKSTNIRMWASIALLTADKPVSQEILISIADDVTERERFSRILHSRGFGDKFPDRYRNNADAAAANMVQWLMHPNELGEAPAAFELAKRFEYNDSGETVEYFVYRFKAKASEDEPDPKWLMGVCGPYTVGTFDTEGGAHTFSRFKEWDPALLEQEVSEVRKLIDDAWKDKLAKPSRPKLKW